MTNIHGTFDTLNDQCFGGSLPDSHDPRLTLRISKRMTRAWGRCSWQDGAKPPKPWNSYVIVVSDTLCWSFFSFTRTLLHEMAHLVLYVRGDRTAGHGPRWQQEYLRAAAEFDKHYDHPFGDSMQTYAQRVIEDQYAECHDATATACKPPKYTLVCPACGREFQRSRLSANLRGATVERRPNDPYWHHRSAKTGDICDQLLSVKRNR